MWRFIKRFLGCVVLAFLIVAISAGYFGVDWEPLANGIVHATPFLSEDMGGFVVVLSIFAIVLLLAYGIFRLTQRIFGRQMISRIALFLASGAVLLDWLTGGCFGIGDYLGADSFDDLALVWIIGFIICTIMLINRIKYGPSIKGGGGGGFGDNSIDVEHQGSGTWRGPDGKNYDGPLGATGETKSIKHISASDYKSSDGIDDFKAR